MQISPVFHMIWMSIFSLHGHLKELRDVENVLHQLLIKQQIKGAFLGTILG